MSLKKRPVSVYASRRPLERTIDLHQDTEKFYDHRILPSLIQISILATRRKNYTSMFCPIQSATEPKDMESRTTENIYIFVRFGFSESVYWERGQNIILST